MDMAEAIIITTVISTLGGLTGLASMQRFWDHKWDKNFEFEKFKISQSNKMAKTRMKWKEAKNPAPKSLLGNLTQFLPILQSLDPDQIKSLAGIFMEGESYDEAGEEEEGIIGQIIKAIPPETITEFLKGAMPKSQEKEQGKGY